MPKNVTFSVTISNPERSMSDGIIDAFQLRVIIIVFIRTIIIIDNDTIL